MPLQPPERRAVTESQDGFARIGGAGFFEVPGGVLESLLMHPHQPAQMQQPRVIAKALQIRPQNGIGGSNVARPQILIGKRQALLEGGTGVDCDHTG
jgi:hypothetical protein